MIRDQERRRVDQMLCFVTGNLDSRTIGLVCFFFKFLEKGFIIYARKVLLLFLYMDDEIL